MLGVLTLASLTYFGISVWKRLAPMRRAVERDLRFDRLGRRLRTVVEEVLLQTRVLANAPLPDCRTRWSCGGSSRSHG